MKKILPISEETMNVFLENYKHNILKVNRIDSEGLFQVVGNQETVDYAEYALQLINFVESVKEMFDVKVEFITHGHLQYFQIVKKK